MASSTACDEQVVTGITTAVADSNDGSRQLIDGGVRSKSIVSSMKFPIPYVIPYKKFLLEELKDPTSMVMHLPEDEVLEEFSIIQMEKSLPTLSDLEVFAMKPLLSSPLYWDDPYVDVASFPHLFPDGRNGLFQERKRTVTPAYYIESRFRLSDPRFRRDQTYLFDCAIRKDMMSINSSIYTMLNSGRFGSVTAGQLKKAMKNPEQSSNLERNVSTMMGQVVGTPQYWLKVRYDLEAFIEEFGAATFFFTASCSEYKIDDFREFLILRNTDLPNVNATGTRNLVSIDPVSVALHFHKKFTCFWDNVIMNKGGPLGEVEHYYVRKEYQQRGAPHMHVLLWIKNAPVHGEDSDEDVLNFISKRITCALPDPVTSPLLHHLVNTNQTHCCSKSCLRTKTVKGKFYCSFCRYGFPRKVSTAAEINSVESILQAKASGAGRKRLYTLPRKADEVFINDYNPAILFMWESNIDVQYIKDTRQCLVYYTTVYVCKAEKQLMSQVAETINANLTIAGQAKQMACRLLSSRQLGAFEAADKVLRHPLYKLSGEVKMASLYFPGEERRRLKTKTQLDGLLPESTEVYCNNFQNSYYPERPEALDDCSAYEVLRSYEIKYGKPSGDTSLYMPKFNARFAKRRKKAVIRLWKAKGDDPHVLERYCFQVVALFQPWRSYEDLLKNDDGTNVSTYTEAYEALQQKLPDMQQFESSRRRLKEMLQWAEKIQHEVQQKLEANVTSGREQNIASIAEDAVQDLDLELCQFSDKLRGTLTEEAVKENYNRLNTVQKEAFDLVLQQIRGSGSHIANQLASKQVFVSGVGGTGKSFLIMALRHHLEYYYSSNKGPAVLVAAPTGVAAANIDGLTVHKLLKLPVSKTRDSSSVQYWPLLPQDVKIYRSLFRKAKLLIIDEVSMLSNLYLLFIHKRLNEILVDEDKDPFARFGNLNILLLGDLLQLPPVNAPHVCEPVSRRQIENSFKSLGGGFSLWTLFEFVELSENMRQRDDPVYASMLDRIRIGSPTASDISLLRERLIVSSDDADSMDWSMLLPIATAKFLEMMKEDPYTLCLMPINDSVTSFNEHIMTVLNMQVVVCKALDETMMAVTTGSRSRSKKKKKDDNISKKPTRQLTTAETGGLEDELLLAVGARVMLRRNIDVQLKLVNGSIGYIRRIDTNPATSKPFSIAVQFQGVAEVTPITRVKVKYYIGANLFVERSQFPLTLAYAITVHKCQGLSLQSALLHLGPHTFSDGMAYVALSRVKRLSSLHIIQLCSSKLTCQKVCVQEYNRLRNVTGVGVEITGYNLNPELVNLRKKVLIDSDYQKYVLREEAGMASRYAPAAPLSGAMLRNKKTSSATRKPKPVRDQVPALRSGEYLKFKNTDGHSCFANAVVQCLLRCKLINDPLRLHSRTNAIATVLCSIFHHQADEEEGDLETDSLRDAFGTNSQFSTGMAMNCDPVEFVMELIEQLPVQVADMFRHFKSFKGCCPQNDCGVENVVQEFTEQYIELGSDPDVDRYTIQEVFRTRSMRKYRCIACNNLCDEFPTDAQYEFPTANRYLILNVPVMIGGEMIGKALLGIRERGLSLFGQRWNFVASVQTSAHELSLPSTGRREFMETDDLYRHYIAYAHRADKSWVKLDDTYQMVLKNKPPCLRMVLIFLERI